MAALPKPLQKPLIYPRKVQALVMVLAAVIGSLTLVSSDRLYTNDEMRFDAKLYAAMAKDFVFLASHHEIDQYHTQRVLPSALVYFGFRLGHITGSDRNVIIAFQILDAVLVFGIALVWTKLSLKARLSRNAYLLGAIALLVNFAVLKHRTYDPVLTDTAAYFLSCLMLYGYLARKPFVLGCSALAGAFTWPTLFAEGFLLWLFPFTKTPADLSAAPNTPSRLQRTVAIAAALLYSATAVYLLKIHYALPLPTYLPAAPVSVILGAGYTFLGVVYLFPRKIDLRLIGRPFLARLSAGCCCYLLISEIRKPMAIPGALSYGWVHYLYVTVISSITYPLVFLVAHVVYFGPICYLVVFNWRRVASRSHCYGGLTACLLLCLANALNAESRGILNFYPILVLVTLLAIDGFDLTNRSLAIFWLLSLVMSKVWLTIGPLTLRTNRFLGDESEMAQLLLDNQRFFMNNGPAMGRPEYVLQAGVALTVGIVLVALRFLTTARRETIQ